MTREDLIRNLRYTMKKHKNDKLDTFGTDITRLCEDVLSVLEQDTQQVELQEWISPTTEPLSVAEAKKLLYQEFKDKMKDGNSRLLVAYEIAMKALETQTERISVSAIEKIHDAIDNAPPDTYIEDFNAFALTKEHVNEIIDKAVKECTHEPT